MRLGNRYAVNQHNKAVATRRSSSRAAETRELGDRYLGPAGPEQTYLKAVTTGGSLGTTGGSLGSYFGAQDVGAMHQDLGKIRQSYFGGQSLGMLSDNEKRLAAIGVLAIVGWFVFGKQVKKGFTSNPPHRKSSLKEFRYEVRHVLSDRMLRNKLASFKSKPKTKDNKARRAIVVTELLNRGITK